jgi:hypothetical protein
MILGDAKYQELVSAILQYDLTGYDVYITGSIIRGRAAKDLDVVIVGEWDHDRLASIFEPLNEIKELDLYFQEVPPLAYSAGSTLQRGRQLQWLGDSASLKKRSEGVEMGKFQLKWFTVPTPKSKARGYNYAEPLMIIQNGEQIYF